MDFLPSFLNRPWSPRFAQTVLPGVLFTLTLAAGAAAVGLRRRQARRRLRLRFAVLWDRELRPRCPNCRALLEKGEERAGWRFEREGEGGRTVRVPAVFFAFACPKCRRLARLVDDDGYEVDFEQARAQVAAEEREP